MAPEWGASGCLAEALAGGGRGPLRPPCSVSHAVGAPRTALPPARGPAALSAGCAGVAPPLGGGTMHAGASAAKGTQQLAKQDTGAGRKRPPAARPGHPGGLGAKPGRPAPAPAAGARPPGLAPYQRPPTLLAPAGLLVDHRSEHTRPPVATTRSGWLGHRGSAAPREDQLGRGTGAALESGKGPAPSGAAGSGR
jgi:hypothetical protein